jgi:predicted acyltransferase
VLVRRRERRTAVRPSHHLESLDAFRGITIAGMILVNNPGTWDAVYTPLVHADWNGCTLADVVYPFFIVILGVALPFALARRRESGHQLRRLHGRIVRRAVLLFLLGLILNLVAANLSWSAVRIPGVLQRIALVYLIAAVITLHAPPRVRAALAVALLAGHWFLLQLAPLTPALNISSSIDRAIFGRHILTATGDPEGLLGTMSAVASALIGTVAGHWLRTVPSDRRRIAALVAGGTALVIAGWWWSFALPLNKSLWTGSYVLVTAGLALVILAICYAVIDVWQIRGWARAFVWLGLNPLAIYFLAELVSHLLDATNLKTILYWSLLRSAVHPPLGDRATSLAFAVLTVALWTAVAGLMYRRGVRVQV